MVGLWQKKKRYLLFAWHQVLLDERKKKQMVVFLCYCHTWGTSRNDPHINNSITFLFKKYQNTFAVHQVKLTTGITGSHMIFISSEVIYKDREKKEFPCFHVQTTHITSPWKRAHYVHADSALAVSSQCSWIVMEREVRSKLWLYISLKDWSNSMLYMESIRKNMI